MHGLKLYVNSTCTKSSCQKEYLYKGYVQQYTESWYIISVAYPRTSMHNSSLITCNRMHVNVTMFVSMCTIITRCMPHTCITIWYVQVYCILECGRICHYDDVQVHVCNNASVCISVRAPCTMCKETTPQNHCNHSRVGQAGRRREF